MNTSKLVEQLKCILVDIERNNINRDQIDIIKEFILKMNFNQFNINHSEKDLMKYLSIGWYVCQNINNL